VVSSKEPPHLVASHKEGVLGIYDSMDTNCYVQYNPVWTQVIADPQFPLNNVSLTIVSEGLQNLGLYSDLWLYLATTAVRQDLGFCGLT
jgi:hypothetical protein